VSRFSRPPIKTDRHHLNEKLLSMANNSEKKHINKQTKYYDNRNRKFFFKWSLAVTFPRCIPVKIWVRMDPPHPLVCRTNVRATNWGGPSDETEKNENPCHSRCGTIKIPPCSKALSAERRPKICSPSPAMVTSPYTCK
jgi:hypothetical protein